MRLGMVGGRVGAAALIGIALLAGGCARPTGDFGRASPSVMHDRLMPAIGAYRAASDGEPVSSFNLTDQEREMHDRVWRFLVAPHARDWFYDTAVELQRTRITSNVDVSFLPDRYYDHLRSAAYQSSRVRYGTLDNDITIDLMTLPGTFAAICNVIEVDRQRAIAIANVGVPPDAGRAEVAARKWENDTRIAWFTRALTYRFDSYSTALDRLLVETPHEEARIVDARLGEMQGWVRAAQSGAFCAHGGAGGPVYKDTGIESRFATQPTGAEPIYRK